jgi:hypothetical protein
MDDNKALNKDGEEAIQTSTPDVEQKATEEVEEPNLETAVSEKEETTETEDVQKKGYSQRVQELANKARAAEERAKSLEERIAEITGSYEPQAQMPTYTPQVQPGEEISPEQYKQDVLRSADALVTLRVKQSEAINRINTETSEAMRAYPELDPDNENFNSEISDMVTEATEAHIKANPYSASVKSFVGKMMKPYKQAVTREVGKAQETVAKQVSEAALRPTSIRKTEKSASEMTLNELEQKLGVVHS